ncbi:Sir2 family NAD-dependent protein deacetylase [Curvibacter sp. APW13]|uniref:SIR2 family NAD-dependent protein deacylase n=1 Tax=Curvibacter sp. APW13 TaxID=3077236 RepID=UPI0028DD5D8A|nr:Sir2 family NAD-dependent protein deacetylase [Curvibacter sp. APW13]MDT8992641.1 Sir2 family NAD-dependent protein deacetylase [Curvibacter sp. APW13]
MDALLKAHEILTQADALVIGAGAGMGVDSGLPDFRGNDGFWKAYPALGSAGLSFTQVASPTTFHQDPRLAWGFYGHRLDMYRKVNPHAGFSLLKFWMERMPLGGRVFTSNVDGQFQTAGFAQDSVHECHGSIHHLQCLNNCIGQIWNADGFEPSIDTERCRLLNELPTCPDCGAIARPNVLMFGDWDWEQRRTAQQSQREDRWLEVMAQERARVVVVEIGAGTAIPSVRHFSHKLIRDLGARLIRINVRESQVPDTRDVGLAMGALEALTGIDAIDNN